MHRALAAATLLALAAADTGAQDADPATEPMRIEGGARWGTIKDLRDPEYPWALRDFRGKIHLDLSGIVSYSGEMIQVEFTPGSDEARHMIEPMRAALRRYWRFVTPTDRRCQPSGAPVKTRVSFDFSTDPPTLSTQTPDARTAPNTLKAVSRVDPVWPGGFMIDRFWGAVVFTRVGIDPAGNVADVLAIAYPKQEGVDLSPFADTTIHALRQWKFNPDPEAKGNRWACYDVFYQHAPRERRRR